jgi:Ca2+:H+ antiporter
MSGSDDDSVALTVVSPTRRQGPDSSMTSLDVSQTEMLGGRSVPRLGHSVLKDGFCTYLCNSLRLLSIGAPGERPWLNLLIPIVPFALMSPALGWPNALSFTLALLAICPFAERLNFVTEDLAKYTNATIGGLLNASFGNVTELIVSIMALRSGELWIIRCSMLGSILSNLLLVLGTAFLVGGCCQRRRKQRAGPGNDDESVAASSSSSSPGSQDGVLQSYNLHAANVNISLLVLCAATYTLPSLLASDVAAATNVSTGEALVYDAAAQARADASNRLFTAIVALALLVVYCCYLAFQLKTHKTMFDDDEENDDDEPPVLGLWGAMFWLGVATACIAVMSDILVDSFTAATGGLGVPSAFLWTILVPIIGNASEHASAVVFAYVMTMDYDHHDDHGARCWCCECGWLFVEAYQVVGCSLMRCAPACSYWATSLSP